MAGEPLDVQHPLASFSRLSPSVYLQEPDETVKYKGQYPKTIVLAFWMNAPPRALAKYVLEYRRLAPAARIIFVLSSSNDFLFGASKDAQQTRVMPAVEAIRASSSPGDPVFLHMFSNGGVSSTTNLLATYEELTGNPLRVSSMIFDSAPGTTTVSGVMKAFSFAFPGMLILRFLLKVALYAFLFLNAIFRRFTGTKDAITTARDAMNDSRILHGIDPKGRPRRCYIYSDADDLVGWRDVERHAYQAKSMGCYVRREKFIGSPHVSHMRADPERYWGIVQKYLFTRA